MKMKKLEFHFLRTHKIKVILILSGVCCSFISIAHAKFPPPFSVEEVTISSIHSAIKLHQTSCQQIVALYLARIKQFNLSAKNQPPFNAFTQINENVLDQARQLDYKFFSTNKFVGPLHCIPVLLKDNIDSFDGSNSAGSFAMLGNQPVKDAVLTSQLRKAGAVILGHSTMDEFAWGLYGISSRSGRTGNAFNSTKNPGGSSAGSAVAVSANFVSIAIGTDNSGSVRIPAAFNGIVGLRPTKGLISQQGIIPMGNLDGVAGPLTRTVTDLAIVMDVLTDYKYDYVKYLNQNGLQHKRIGIVRYVGNIDTFKDMPDNIQVMIKNSFQQFHNLGAEIIDNLNLTEFENNRKYNMAGTIEDVNQYLAGFPSVRKNFQDICESNRTRTFGKNTKDCISFMNSVKNHSSVEYKNVLAMFERNKNYVEKLMNQYQLDALFIPIARTGSATYDPLKVNTWQAPVSSNSGLPSIVVNIGYENNMPVGIELVGKSFNENNLIQMAYAYEQHSPKRRIPVMPDANSEEYTIAEFNNLISVIGKTTYEKILKNGISGEQARLDLTPQIFKSIVSEIKLKSASTK